MKACFPLFFLLTLAFSGFSQVGDGVLVPRQNGIDTAQVWETVQEQPEFPGGIKELYKYLVDNLKYPVSEKENGIQGKVFVKFIVEKEGSITGITILKGVPGGSGFDKEAIRVIQAMPPWKPGKQNGHVVRCYSILPIKFALSDPGLEAYFPGGKAGMDKYIYSNLKYPKQAKKDKTEGYVTIAFEVDPTGKTVNASLLESLGHGCDEEALRLVNNMPKWTPGADQKENTKTSVRIKFELKKK
jgi:TonB family protein